MKILWVNSNFLHPTTKGGQIRTLEMLRRLHRWHEIHYVAIEDPQHPEGPARAEEYSSRAYPFQYKVVDKRSAAFVMELARGVFDGMPLAVRRFYPPKMGAFLERLIQTERFDQLVCDFLHPAAYFPHIERAVLFQHNVETMIWRRRAQHAVNPAGRWYLEKQADRMFRFERDICLRAGHVVAVSEQDAGTMRELFGATRVTAIPTGVDIEYFASPGPPPARATDLVFVGSMDWQPNIDGIEWFVRETLPLIRRARPGCSLSVVGRKPPPSIRALAERDPAIRVTGTVPDVRPYLWDAAISVVPLRIGGGTRLKIYEAMAAGTPVVSTTVGAEGLKIRPPHDIRIADSPEEFASACVDLLADTAVRERQAEAARKLTAAFSWESVARQFESVFELTAQRPLRAYAAGAGDA